MVNSLLIFTRSVLPDRTGWVYYFHHGASQPRSNELRLNSPRILSELNFKTQKNHGHLRSTIFCFKKNKTTFRIWVECRHLCNSIEAQTTCPTTHFWSISRKSRQPGTKTPLVEPPEPRENPHSTGNQTTPFVLKRSGSCHAGG